MNGFLYEKISWFVHKLFSTFPASLNMSRAFARNVGLKFITRWKIPKLMDILDNDQKLNHLNTYIFNMF